MIGNMEGNQLLFHQPNILQLPQGLGNGAGGVLGTYRITTASITKAKVSIKDQTYTGKAIELDTKADPQAVYVEEHGTALKPEEYEIVAGSYSNNINKGKAKVVIRGLGNYGGTKTATFKIKGKGLGLFGL